VPACIDLTDLEHFRLFRNALEMVGVTSAGQRSCPFRAVDSRLSSGVDMPGKEI
jgi:hypothetical protein